MIKQNQVIAKLDELKAYSIANNPIYTSQITSVMQPLYGDVEDYFSIQSPQLKQALEDMVFFLFCDIQRRTTVRQNNFDCSLSTDYPESYSDIRKCFYTFPLMNISNETFSGAWTFTTDPVSLVSTAENDYVTTWCVDIVSAPNDDVDRVNSLAEWCQNACGNTNMINLLEDLGVVTESLDTPEIARRIYEDKHLSEVITDRSLTVYVPTYLRG